MLEKFENVALFLLLGLPSTLIRHENEASKKLFKQKEFETLALRFRVDGIHFFNGTFQKDDVTIIM